MLVEFALAVPVLAAVLIGIIDLGSGIHDMLSLRAAARAGAEYAVARPTDQAGISAAVMAATDFGDETVSVATTSSCECPSGAAVSCGANCPNGGVLREYIKVRVTQPFTPLFAYSQYLMPSEIAGEAIVRVR